jgi:hypothetical protein
VSERYSLKADTARRLGELLGETDDPVEQSPARGGTRGKHPILVRCTSITAASGSAVGSQCYPAVIIDTDAVVSTQVELPDPVWLTLLTTSGAATAPTLNALYHGLFAGEFDPAADSRPRVFAVAPAGAAAVNNWLNTNGSFYLSNASYPANTWVAFGSGLVLPSAGTYNIYYNCYGYYNVAGSIGTAKWEARFSSSVLGGVVPGSESVIVMPQVANQYIYGSSAKYMRYFATASDTITVEMMQTVLGQLTTPLLHHRTMGYDMIA